MLDKNHELLLGLDYLGTPEDSFEKIIWNYHLWHLAERLIVEDIHTFIESSTSWIDFAAIASVAKNEATKLYHS